MLKLWWPMARAFCVPTSPFPKWVNVSRRLDWPTAKKSENSGGRWDIEYDLFHSYLSLLSPSQFISNPTILMPLNSTQSIFPTSVQEILFATPECVNFNQPSCPHFTTDFGFARCWVKQPRIFLTTCSVILIAWWRCSFLNHKVHRLTVNPPLVAPLVKVPRKGNRRTMVKRTKPKFWSHASQKYHLVAWRSKRPIRKFRPRGAGNG